MPCQDAPSQRATLALTLVLPPGMAVVANGSLQGTQSLPTGKVTSRWLLRGAARDKYEALRQTGHDKSLVFANWHAPTAEDRSLVYDKGAYVTHLLRQHLGEQAFWDGLRAYTRQYWGKSVQTADFQHAMEQSSGRDLSDFFDRWVYLQPIR